MNSGHVLIAGASGLVGRGVLRRYLEIDGWKVTTLSRRQPHRLTGANSLSVDLSDPEACEAVACELADVTHFVYAAVNEKEGSLLESWTNESQIQLNARMLQNIFGCLERASSALSHVTLLQGTKAYGAHLGPIPIPARERADRHAHRNFYFEQEDYIRERQRGSRWSWTILRPQLIIGDATASNLNIVTALGVYGAILREANEPLHYPGSATVVTEMTDVDLLADAIVWAGGAETSRGETFNVTNGDVMSMREVWPVVASAMGMAVGEDRPISLAEEMPKHAEVWRDIVRREGLEAPEDMAAFVGESLHLADHYCGGGDFRVGGSPEVSRPVLVSTVKIRAAGFQGCIDTEDMLRKWFRRSQASGLLPRPE